MEKFSPKIQAERDKAAKAIKYQRNLDRGKEAHLDMGWRRARGILDYTMELGGLKHFLDYARSLSEQPIVLDIGAGSTRAFADLLNIEEWSKGLKLEATSLHRDKDINKFLGEDNLKLTSVENLRGIADGELAGIVSLHGIGHTKAPSLAAESIHRVLMPGGILKAAFQYDVNYDPDLLERNQRLLIDALKSLQFNTASTSSSQTVPVRVGGKIHKIRIRHTHLTAVKPPIKEGFSAIDLARADSQDSQEQINFLVKLGFEPVMQRLGDKK